LLRTGSIKALHGAHDDALLQHERERGRAVRVFELAGDLAPVFGLVGTLFSLTQLAPELGVDAQDATMSALATAVLSSLYGVLAAHFLFLPLANALTRRSLREDEARVSMIEWLAKDIADTVPDGRAPRLCAVSSVV
jgi:chemotaxis protein MotA